MTHTDNSMDALDEVFCEQFLSQGLWHAEIRTNTMWTIDKISKNSKRIIGINFPQLPYISFNMCLEMYYHDMMQV
jgi:hypothetical protein